MTYQLGFYPQDVNWDGSFHKLHVKVNRPDAHVQTREGYFALAEPKVAAQTWSEMISEIARSPVAATGIRFRAQVTPPQESGERKLSLLLALDTAQFQFEQQNGLWNGLVEATFIQLDKRSQIVQTSGLRKPLAINPEIYEQLMKQGLMLRRELSLLPDAVGVQVIVRDGGSDRIGSVHFPLAP